MCQCYLFFQREARQGIFHTFFNGFATVQISGDFLLCLPETGQQQQTASDVFNQFHIVIVSLNLVSGYIRFV